MSNNSNIPSPYIDLCRQTEVGWVGVSKPFPVSQTSKNGARHLPLYDISKYHGLTFVPLLPQSNPLIYKRKRTREHCRLKTTVTVRKRNRFKVFFKGNKVTQLVAASKPFKKRSFETTFPNLKVALSTFKHPSSTQKPKLHLHTDALYSPMSIFPLISLSSFLNFFQNLPTSFISILAKAMAGRTAG